MRVRELSLVQRTRWLLVVLGLVLLTAGGVYEAPAQAPTAKVASIDIRGNQKIELPAIQGRLTLKPGDAYSPENVRGQIKILYDTGYFEDVQAETESTSDGIALVFVVREKPFITEIVFDGNEELSDDKLKEKTHDQEPGIFGSAAGEGKRGKNSPCLSRRRIFQRPSHPDRPDLG